MRILSEDEEFLIFDYLEGNLSNTQNKVVQNLIETDIDFKAEYLLMQKTFLPASDLIFENKNNLLKSRSFFFFNRTFAIAASIALLIGFGLVMQNNSGKIGKGNSICIAKLPNLKTQEVNKNFTTTQKYVRSLFAVLQNKEPQIQISISSIIADMPIHSAVFDDVKLSNKGLSYLNSDLVFEYNPKYVNANLNFGNKTQKRVGILTQVGNFYSRSLEWIKPPKIAFQKENIAGQKQYVLSLTAAKYEMLAYFK